MSQLVKVLKSGDDETSGMVKEPGDRQIKTGYAATRLVFSFKHIKQLAVQRSTFTATDQWCSRGKPEDIIICQLSLVCAPAKSMEKGSVARRGRCVVVGGCAGLNPTRARFGTQILLVRAPMSCVRVVSLFSEPFV